MSVNLPSSVVPQMPALPRRPEWRSPPPALVIHSQQSQTESPTAKRWRRLGAIASWLGLACLSLPSGNALATLPSEASVQDGLEQTSTQVVIQLPKLPITVVSSPISVRSEAEGDETELPPAAPAVLWLIVMPAVPIVGGAVIYLSRRLLGRANGTCRLVTHQPLPESPNLELPTLDKTDTPQDP